MRDAITSKLPRGRAGPPRGCGFERRTLHRLLACLALRRLLAALGALPSRGPDALHPWQRHRRTACRHPAARCPRGEAHIRGRRRSIAGRSCSDALGPLTSALLSRWCYYSTSNLSTNCWWPYLAVVTSSSMIKYIMYMYSCSALRST